jgi:hypothetical protein
MKRASTIYYKGGNSGNSKNWYDSTFNGGNTFNRGTVVNENDGVKLRNSRRGLRR